MMTDITIRPATEDDLPLLDQALRALSADLGDAHVADRATLGHAGFGPDPSFRALLALSGDALCGVAMFSPVFSTVMGAPGLYVSDLWVAPPGRGEGLGGRLLAAAATHAAALWDARFMKLAVYDGAPRARAFYDRLGFTPATGETVMRLDGPDFDRLKGQT